MFWRATGHARVVGTIDRPNRFYLKRTEFRNTTGIDLHFVLSRQKPARVKSVLVRDSRETRDTLGFRNARVKAARSK